MTAVIIIIFQVFWSLLVGFIKLLPHGFKYGWVFLLAGIVGALFVRDAAFWGQISAEMAVFLYILSIGSGIALMALKLWWNKKQQEVPEPIDKEVSSEYRDDDNDVSDEYR